MAFMNIELWDQSNCSSTKMFIIRCATHFGKSNCLADQHISFPIYQIFETIDWCRGADELIFVILNNIQIQYDLFYLKMQVSLMQKHIVIHPVKSVHRGTKTKFFFFFKSSTAIEMNELVFCVYSGVLVINRILDIFSRNSKMYAIRINFAKSQFSFFTLAKLFGILWIGVQ